MSTLDLIRVILSGAWNIAFPFGLTFGGFTLAIWSLPLIRKLIGKIF